MANVWDVVISLIEKDRITTIQEAREAAVYLGLCDSYLNQALNSPTSERDVMAKLREESKSAQG